MASDDDKVSIREFIVVLFDERSKRYDDKFYDSEKAINAALIAQKEQVTTAFAAAKEASFESKQAQNTYNALHNDLQRKMERLIQEFVTKPEFKDVKDDIRILREWKSNVEGRFAVIIAVSSFLTLILSIAVGVLLHFIR